MGLRIAQGLFKTRQGVFGRIGALLRSGDVNEEFWDELEALLIQGDVGVETTSRILENVRAAVKKERARDRSAVRKLLIEEIVTVTGTPSMPTGAPSLEVMLVVGVNGSGKTTTVAKLGAWYRARSFRVVLAAADTFRAAAIDQLKLWGERASLEVVAHQPGGNPGAVVYDAIQACQARGANLLIADTAGRLHTKYNLMEELKKVRGVVARQIAGAPHQVLLVLDATTGQNGLAQAKAFKEAVGVTGVVVTKLDGTAKGGVVLSIAHELGLAVQFVGTGEGIDDIARFDAREFASGLIGE